MYKITKEFSFCASHELTNLRSEHPCSRVHGHNYVVKLELVSKTLNKVGFVVDYRDLSRFKKWIDEKFDHRHLNDVMKFNPTAENIARHIYNIWKPVFPNLRAVEVSETPKTNARYEED